MTRLHRGFTAVRPSGLLLACSPRMEQEPLGLHPDASHPAVTHNARQGRRQALSTGLELHLRHCRTSIGVFTHNVRPRVAPAAPPHPAHSAVDVPIPPRLAGCRPRAGTATRWFPCSLWFAQWSRSPTVSQRPRHQYAADLPGDLPRAAHPSRHRRVPAATVNSETRRARPKSARLESVIRVEGRNNAGSSRTPLRHVRRTRTIWQC